MRWFISIILLLLASQAWAFHTPGGVTWTQEELAIWQARATDGGTYQTIYTDNILPGANTCLSDCSGDNWDGILSEGSANVCISTASENESGPTGKLGTGKARNSMNAGFVYLITGTTTYRDAVEQMLLDQTAIIGTDFTRTQHWCPGSSNWTFSTLWVGNWLWKMFLAYDYIRADISTGNRATIDAWFLGAANYWINIEGAVITDQKFSGRPNDYTCDQFGCPAAFKGEIEFQGADVYGFHLGGWDNQHSTPMAFSAGVALMTEDATKQAAMQVWFNEIITYATFSDGAPSDQYRWNDTVPASIASSWSHLGVQVVQWVNIADMFARAGDFDLIEFSTSSGLFGTDGGPKSLGLVTNHIAQMANGTKTVYAGTTEENKLVLTYDVENGHVEDLGWNRVNLFWQDAEVETAMNRTIPASPSCGGYYCYGEPWGGNPDMRLTGKQLLGKVYPYPARGLRKIW